MLVCSMTVSADGFVTDRDGGIDWGTPTDEVLEHHLAHVGSLGAYLLGRRLYETMRVWETEPSMRETEAGTAFADVWSALTKVVFSRTLDRVEGVARLAVGPLAEEVAAALAATDRDVSIGGADLAAQAVRLDLVDEFRLVRDPVLIGGGTPYFPALPERRALDLVETRRFDSGAIFEQYRRRR